MKELIKYSPYILLSIALLFVVLDRANVLSTNHDLWLAFLLMAFFALWQQRYNENKDEESWVPPVNYSSVDKAELGWSTVDGVDYTQLNIHFGFVIQAPYSLNNAELRLYKKGKECEDVFFVGSYTPEVIRQSIKSSRRVFTFGGGSSGTKKGDTLHLLFPKCDREKLKEYAFHVTYIRGDHTTKSKTYPFK
ncbi:MAG: hypothetical protein PHW63_06465 [Alphaproteobacteria bacterium]|nr:hypothetical protein [Alphaproteobacteria bacterium]